MEEWSGGGEDDGDDMSKFEAGSAIDQLLYPTRRRSAVWNRALMSAEQFMKRKIASEMLNALIEDGGEGCRGRCRHCGDEREDLVATGPGRRGCRGYKDIDEEDAADVRATRRSGGHPGLGASSSSSAAALQLTYRQAIDHGDRSSRALARAATSTTTTRSSMVSSTRPRRKSAGRLSAQKVSARLRALCPRPRRTISSNARYVR